MALKGKKLEPHKQYHIETMPEEEMLRLKEMYLAPYIKLATPLIAMGRKSGGNMFRHQVDTFAILISYGYIDSVLLKASLIHDLKEDLADFNPDRLLEIDDESQAVYQLVLEVTRRPIETKCQFLSRILEYGSKKALILKCADRISNMTDLGYTTEPEFIERYSSETETYIFPMAEIVDKKMLEELKKLVESRRAFLNR